jgi:class 3 adenylate cyclase
LGFTMICPKCQTEMPEETKFCDECGSRLEIVCGQCNKVNRLGAKFCNECGQVLTAPSEFPQIKALSGEKTVYSQPPKELSEKILAQKGRIEGERRQVTVMFCDLEGSTALTEKLGDEQAFALIDEIFGILTRQVHKYEGTVQEFRGDGIMALFGAPIALENAAQRAVSAALAIQQEVTKFSHRIQEEARGPAIRMRIGIHTGPVVLGSIGSDLRLEFQVIGDTVNLAARVESLAESGTIYVTEEAFKLTEGYFRFEGMGERQVKGKESPVKVYLVIAPSSQRIRFDVSAEQGLAPFVGRRRELELLLDGFERAKGGKGQAFSIISEAGLGKSRLLYEFRRAVSNEEITFLEGRRISYGRGLAYYPIIAILRSNFNIQEGEEDLLVKGKVKKGLENMGVEVGATLPYLLELLSVKDSGLDPLSMSPESKREKMFEAIKRIILKGSEIRPLVIAIEDLHWMDKSSEEALKTILESIPGSPVLAIFTYRPEFIPSWGGKTFHSQLMLQRLSNRESLKMASNLLGSGEMEKSLEELLLEKAEGIPFFLEEFVKSLKDLKLIEQRGAVYGLSKSILEMTVPTTIQE